MSDDAMSQDDPEVTDAVVTADADAAETEQDEDVEGFMDIGIGNPMKSIIKIDPGPKSTGPAPGNPPGPGSAQTPSKPGGTPGPVIF